MLSCASANAVSLSLTDRAMFFFFNENLLFGLVLLLNYGFLLFHCEWYEMKQCLAPYLLSSNFSQQVMTICLLLLNDLQFDAYRWIWSKWGFRKSKFFEVLFLLQNGWFWWLYILVVVRSICEGWNLTNLSTFLYDPKFNKKLNFDSKTLVSSE